MGLVLTPGDATFHFCLVIASPSQRSMDIGGQIMSYMIRHHLYGSSDHRGVPAIGLSPSPPITGYSVNKQRSYRVVDVLTTDTRSMSYEISALIENVERKCFIIRGV